LCPVDQEQNKMPRQPASEAAKLAPTRIPWRERPLQTLKTASEIAGVSVSSLYRLAAEGKLRFRKLAGRTVVETPSLVALVDSAEAWTPSDRGKAARARRSEIARAAWRN
jgi:hypothetical protein